MSDTSQRYSSSDKSRFSPSFSGYIHPMILFLLLAGEQSKPKMSLYLSLYVERLTSDRPSLETTRRRATYD